MTRVELYTIGAHGLGIINASIAIDAYDTHPLLAILAVGAMLACANVLRMLDA